MAKKAVKVQDPKPQKLNLSASAPQKSEKEAETKDENKSTWNVSQPK